MQNEALTTAMPGDSDSKNLPTVASTPTDVSEAAATTTTNNRGSKFDPKNYRQVQSQKMEEAAGWGWKMQTVIPVRKPSKKQFVRAHSSPEFRVESMPTITDEATGDVYLLAAELDLPIDVENKIDYLNLAAGITADGSVFLWFYKHSTNSWSESARIAINQASKRWVRVIPDKSSNGYLLESPLVAPPEPVWPLMTFTELLEAAFGARYIETLAHPQIKKLRGDFYA